MDVNNPVVFGVVFVWIGRDLVGNVCGKGNMASPGYLFEQGHWLAEMLPLHLIIPPQLGVRLVWSWVAMRPRTFSY